MSFPGTRSHTPLTDQGGFCRRALSERCHPERGRHKRRSRRPRGAVRVAGARRCGWLSVSPVDYNDALGLDHRDRVWHALASNRGDRASELAACRR
jgi:hypothetical protein